MEILMKRLVAYLQLDTLLCSTASELSVDPGGIMKAPVQFQCRALSYSVKTCIAQIQVIIFTKKCIDEVTPLGHNLQKLGKNR